MLYQTFANSRVLFAMLVLSAACIAASGGCGAGEQSAQNDAQLRAGMKLLGLQYGSYLSEKGAPPPDESALRSYLKSRLTRSVTMELRASTICSAMAATASLSRCSMALKCLWRNTLSTFG